MFSEKSQKFDQNLDGHSEQKRDPDVLPKSPFGQAVEYALKNWQALLRYTEAGFLAIDNNAAERALRAVAVGRKNWLFAGSDNGGRTAAVMYTLLASCRRHDIEPWTYLSDVLQRMPSTPTDQFPELLPDRSEKLFHQSTTA